MEVIFKLLPWILLLFLIGAGLQIVAALQKKKGTGLKTHVFERQEALMSAAELKFFRALETAAGVDYRLFSKVRLGDVVQPKRGTDRSAWQSAFGVIKSKHVDFVACDPNDMSFQFVVELDDKSHERPDRAARDMKVDDALAQAGIPIFHFPVKGAYSVQEIQSKIFETPAPRAGA